MYALYITNLQQLVTMYQVYLTVEVKSMGFQQGYDIEKEHVNEFYL